MKPIQIQTYPLISQDQLNPKNKHARCFKGQGILEVLLGVAMITLAGVNINNAQQLMINKDAAEVATRISAMFGSGIWSGTLILICGILGLASSTARNPCPVIGALVLTILTSLSCLTLVVVEAVGALMVKSKEFLMSLHEDRSSERNSTPSYEVDSDLLESMFRLHLVLIGLGIISFLVVIIHSAFTCSASCCKKKNNQGDVAMNSTQQYSVQPGLYQNPQESKTLTENA